MYIQNKVVVLHIRSHIINKESEWKTRRHMIKHIQRNSQYLHGHSYKNSSFKPHIYFPTNYLKAFLIFFTLFQINQPVNLPDLSLTFEKPTCFTATLFLLNVLYSALLSFRHLINPDSNLLEILLNKCTYRENHGYCSGIHERPSRKRKIETCFKHS